MMRATKRATGSCAVSRIARRSGLSTADFVLATAGYCVPIFAALTACALSGSLSHARAALTMPFYWPLSSIAVYPAFFELIFRPH